MLLLIFRFFCVAEKEMSRRLSRTVYVGNLSGDIREREVEDLFLKVFCSLFLFLFSLEEVFLSFSFDPHTLLVDSMA